MVLWAPCPSHPGWERVRTAMAAELLSTPFWPLMDLLRLSCALIYLDGRPCQSGSGCASCPIQAVRSQNAQWEFGKVLKEATGLWAVGEVRGRGKTEFVAHPTRASQACSFALVTAIVCQTRLHVCILPQPTLTAYSRTLVPLL